MVPAMLNAFSYERSLSTGALELFEYCREGGRAGANMATALCAESKEHFKKCLFPVCLRNGEFRNNRVVVGIVYSIFFLLHYLFSPGHCN